MVMLDNEDKNPKKYAINIKVCWKWFDHLKTKNKFDSWQNRDKQCKI
jgi:hypothetical protein